MTCQPRVRSASHSATSSGDQVAMSKTLRAITLMGTIGAVLSAGGCSVSKQDVPSLTGPSEFGTSVVLNASPEILPQDGASQSLVTATARNTAGQPINGLVIRWSAITSDTDSIPSSV